ncbi:MAG: DUF2268 domain-containing putative Zn-dependent protease [Bacillota bacterium]
MSIIPVYRDVLLSLEAARQGSPLWAAFHNIAYRPNQPYFDGLTETYGADLFGPGGLSAVVEQSGPMLHQALRPAPSYQMEERATAILDAVRPHLPGRVPPLYLGTLFFLAPAATLSIAGRPALALGLERFSLQAPTQGEKYLYHPDEVVEMLPHEAAHAVRMEALGLDPTPQRLSLLDMVMLEGTALLFTDLLLGKETLATFMPADRLAWHKANDEAAVATVAREFPATGMGVFTRFFGAGSPVSGYYAGYSLCRRYLDRYGPGAMRELLVLPSAEILRRLA